MPHNHFDTTEIISIVPYNGISPTLIGKVIFEDNVWIGIDVIVSPGVTIKKNSFVRSNSLITKSFEENSYIAGDPAAFKRKRFNY
jgi:maltose O-acetyltransferase